MDLLAAPLLVCGGWSELIWKQSERWSQNLSNDTNGASLLADFSELFTSMVYGCLLIVHVTFKTGEANPLWRLLWCGSLKEEKKKDSCMKCQKSRMFSSQSLQEENKRRLVWHASFKKFFSQLAELSELDCSGWMRHARKGFFTFDILFRAIRIFQNLSRIRMYKKGKK